MSTTEKSVQEHGLSPEVTQRSGMECRLDTVTYTSPEFNELETVVEICEPVEEKLSLEQPPKGPGRDICVSPEFGEIEALI